MIEKKEILAEYTTERGERLTEVLCVKYEKTQAKKIIINLQID